MYGQKRSQRLAEARERVQSFNEQIAEAGNRNETLRRRIQERQAKKAKLSLENLLNRCTDPEEKDVAEELVDGLIPCVGWCLIHAEAEAPEQAGLIKELREALKEGRGEKAARFAAIKIPAGAWGEFQKEPMTGCDLAKRNGNMLRQGRLTASYAGYTRGGAGHSESMTERYKAGQGPTKSKQFAENVIVFTPGCGGGWKEEIGALLRLRAYWDDHDPTKVAYLEMLPSGYNGEER